MPEGWTYDVGVPDHRHIVHKDQEGRIRVELFVKTTPYDSFINIWVLPKLEHKTQKVRDFLTACQKLSTTYEITYGHPMADDYLEESYEEVQNAHRKLSAEEKRNYPLFPRPQAVRSLF